MTMDKSLRTQGKGIETRSVLTRAERLEQLKGAERWQDGNSPFGLPKTRVFKMAIKKKKKAKAEEGDAATPGKAAPAKAAAPAGGAKKK
jgi:small basic protein (TIGR04137 family)